MHARHQRRAAWPALALAALATLLTLASHRAAAFPKRVIVIRGKDCPSILHQNVVRALDQASGRAPVDYVVEAVPDRAGSSSPQALQPIFERQPASLGVVLHTRRVSGGRILRVDFVDGSSARTVVQERLKLASPRLSPRHRRVLASGAVQALSQRGASPETTHAGSADAAPSTSPSSGSTAPPSEYAPESGAPQDADGLPPALNEARTAPPTLHASVSLGVGFGTRAIRLPTPVGERSLSSSGYPAAAVEVAAAWNMERWLRLHFRIGYQTSFAWSVQQPAPAGNARTTSARSHRLELLVGPEFDFADSSTAASLDIETGYALRDFRAVDEVELPSGTLSGPLLRALLRIPLGEGALRVFIGPEAQWIAGVDDAWQALGAGGSGMSLGGIAGVRWQALQAWAVSASYRESHALVGASDGTLHDTQRFGMLNLLWVPDAG